MEPTPRSDDQGITVPMVALSLSLSTPPHHHDHDSPDHAGHDWTADLPRTDHARFFRTADCARSRLGPVSSWTPTLRLFAGFVLADARAACLWWASGEHLVAIYNAAYAPLAAQVHHSLMGSTFKESYPDLWPAISQYFDKARSTGAGVSYSSAAPLLVERKGWREEAFFSGSFTPVGPPHHPDGF
ncbi:hypothetical protein FB567DRAFT_68863 [Paraphoma chrysanthemicola]|uniref:Uncharacterized protein n=1 Tax=Paraphoma chrysanthemicola TaxID=798071 RepID=A0A8K0R3J8_9PLEO|nr:hypothetical protein FB567DRAFT_68863 [Paraphoma chrysanthemicola]